VTVVSDGKLIISEPNFPNKDIWFTAARCTKELGKIMTLESLNLSLTLLNKREWNPKYAGRFRQRVRSPARQSPKGAPFISTPIHKQIQ
jgi:hypothetical protein